MESLSAFILLMTLLASIKSLTSAFFTRAARQLASNITSGRLCRAIQRICPTLARRVLLSSSVTGESFSNNRTLSNRMGVRLSAYLSWVRNILSSFVVISSPIYLNIPLSSLPTLKAERIPSTTVSSKNLVPPQMKSSTWHAKTPIVSPFSVQ